MRKLPVSVPFWRESIGDPHKAPIMRNLSISWHHHEYSSLTHFPVNVQVTKGGILIFTNATQVQDRAKCGLIMPSLIDCWFCNYNDTCFPQAWWRHQMEACSVLLAICAGNSPVDGEFPAQRPVTRSFDVFFDLRPNKRLNKQCWGWWFETQSCPLWRHCNEHLAVGSTTF